jgi:hypothetical protein
MTIVWETDILELDTQSSLKISRVCSQTSFLLAGPNLILCYAGIEDTEVTQAVEAPCVSLVTVANTFTCFWIGYVLDIAGRSVIPYEVVMFTMRECCLLSMLLIWALLSWLKIGHMSGCPWFVKPAQRQWCYLLLNGPFGKESVLYDFSLVALHTISIFSFHLWCMLRGIVWIWMKSNLFRSLGPNSFSVPLVCQNEFDSPWRVENGFCSNVHTTSKQELETCQAWKLLLAKQPTPDQKW